MIFLDDFSMRLMICLLGVVGFFVAKHIRAHKIKDKPLVCMVGFDCHAVVHSDYSKFMGVPVEILGMAYYAFVSIVIFVSLFLGKVIPEVMMGYFLLLGTFLWIASMGAVLFSTYLVIIQIFILKRGCSWCFVSALISILIFALSVIK